MATDYNVAISYIGNSVFNSNLVNHLIKKDWKRANYNKVISLIRKFEINVYNELELKYHNPYYVYKIDGYFMLRHSSNEYLFKVTGLNNEGGAHR